MKRIKLLWKFMNGNRTLYLLAIGAVGIATLFSIVSPLVLRFVIDSIIGNQPVNLPNGLTGILRGLGDKGMLAKNLWLAALTLVILTLSNGIFIYLKGKWAAIAAESTARNIRDKLYDHLQHLSYDYHVKAQTGDLIQRCTSDVDTIRGFLAVQLVEVGRAVFMIATVLPFMLMLSVQMTLVAMAVVPVIFTFALVFFLKVKKAFQQSDEAEGLMSNVLQENLTGVRVVRAFARQAFEIGKFDQKNRRFRDLTYRLIVLLAWYWGSSDLMCLLQIAAVLVLGVYWAASGTITLGTLVVFTTYEGMLLWPVRQMGRILTDMGKTIVSLGRIQEILEQEREPDFEIVNSDENLIEPEITGKIEFRNVWFEYEPNRPLLKDISFKVAPGQTVAILGPTGSGKSTLMHLLPRLYEYQKGCILLDGVELKRISKKWLRANLALVLQEPFLFSRTIRDNIALSCLDADECEIYNAAQCAAVHDVILGFEKGYESPVGERGVTLSGGQLQRIAIARALIRECPIMIFDDSLSAVDSETDAAIRRALKLRKHKATTFIISHRISTLAEADLIIVLEKGELIQSGKHRELIEQPGLYQRIWTIQNKLEQEFESTNT
ncbi:ABC transporter ATP-binding protein [bacterium]|nr:ABC transporter ATP-binding protein [bacterium]